MRRALPIVVVLVAWSARAYAYPQYQISRDQMCTDCHLSPAGGGLLSENGLTNAETFSQWGTSPEFLNGLVSTPKWLQLGGDIRYAAGYTDPQPTFAGFTTFPMQADLVAAATFNAISLHVMAGAVAPDCSGAPTGGSSCTIDYKTLFASREHWVQWQQNPGEPGGLYLRAGRFMPVYGLRLVEHTAYDRFYGGSPLYGETYGVAAEYIQPGFEVHVTGFAHDPLQATTELGNGAAVYAETRLDKATAVGVEGKFDQASDDRKIYGGVTAKHYFASPGVLVQGEVQLVHDKVIAGSAGGTENQLVGYLLGTYFIGAFLIDAGVGYDNPDVHVKYLDHEAADLNIHWFPTSHIELVLINRLQMLELGAGGLSNGYSLLQLHYRL
jgi:hypothetical protein